MTVQEGNKIIAEFMGGVLHGEEFNFGGDRPCFWAEQWYNVKELKYHSSWDWLMPVVEKIKNIYEQESDNWLPYIFDDDYPKIYDLKITESIKSIYNHVTLFIQWYQSLNKKA